jgi:hypothetical protein
MFPIHLFSLTGAFPAHLVGAVGNKHSARMCAHIVRRAECHLFSFAQEIHRSYLMNTLKNSAFLS